jgi:hypothetical protein
MYVVGSTNRKTRPLDGIGHCHRASLGPNNVAPGCANGQRICAFISIALQGMLCKRDPKRKLRD